MRIKFLKDYKVSVTGEKILKGSTASFTGNRMTVENNGVVGLDYGGVPMFDIDDKWISNLKNKKVIKVLK